MDAENATEERLRSLDLAGCAALIGVHRKTLSDEIRAGRLPAWRVGGVNGHYRVKLVDLNDWVEERKVESEEPEDGPAPKTASTATAR